MPSSKIGCICSLRLKFNEILNTVASKFGHLIMNINDCNQEKDFDQQGNPSPQGAGVFWQQVDFLIESFDNKKIELLPTGKNRGNPIYEEEESKFCLSHPVLKTRTFNTKSLSH